MTDSDTEQLLKDMKMNVADLYREDIYTDRKIGTLRRLIPIKPDGSDDDSRETLYVGQAQILTPMGAIPLTFELEAKSLDEACNKFADGAKQALDRTIEEAKEYRRQAASSIVIPDAAPTGKIQLR